MDRDISMFLCIVSGCETVLMKDKSLCIEHEMLYIADHGQPSPECKTIEQWKDLLRTRATWYYDSDRGRLMDDLRRNRRITEL